METELRERHTFARRREHRAVDGEAQRADTQRIAGDEHVSLGIEEHDVVGTVQPGGDTTEDVEQIGSLVTGEFLAQQVHQDFGVGFPGQVEVGVREDFLAQLGVVGQLAVEGEAEPLRLLDVVAFKGLGVAAVVLAAGRVTNVPDRRRSGVFLHQHLGRLGVAEMEHLGDGADVPVGIDQLFAIRAEGGHPGGQLPAVLDVQQQARHQPRGFTGPLRGCQTAGLAVGQVVNRGNATLVK